MSTTALHLLAGCASPHAYELVQVFLAHGADPNAKDPEGLTPVHVAAVWGQYDILRLLLQNGGDVYAQDCDYKDALKHALAGQQADCADLIRAWMGILEEPNDAEHSAEPNEASVSEQNSLNRTFVLATECSAEQKEQRLKENRIVENLQTSPPSDEHLMADVGIGRVNLYPRLSLDNDADWLSDDVSVQQAPATEPRRKQQRFAQFLTSSNNNNNNNRNNNNNNFELDYSGCCLLPPLQCCAAGLTQGVDTEMLSPPYDRACRSEPGKSRHPPIRPARKRDLRRALFGTGEGVSDSELDNQATMTATTTTIDSDQDQDRVRAAAGADKNGDVTESCTNVQPAADVDLDVGFRQSPETATQSKSAHQNRTKEPTLTFVEGESLTSLLNRTLQFSSDNNTSTNNWSNDVRAEIESYCSDRDRELDRTQTGIDDELMCRLLTECRALNDRQLREKLTNLGVDVGPINAQTRVLYVKRLATLLADENRCQLIAEQMGSKFPVELALATSDSKQLSELLMLARSDDSALLTSFNQPNRVWREGQLKMSFCYLLLDPMLATTLLQDAELLPDERRLRLFIDSIFYIGKGKKSRPYQHLIDAAERLPGLKHGVQSQPGNNNAKLARIHSIWQLGGGVVSVHVFPNCIPAEAYTREAAMIDAIGWLVGKTGNFCIHLPAVASCEPLLLRDSSV